MFLCVCCMLSRTHAFLYMWCEFRCPIGPWTLTQCPACELAISLQALTAGGRAYRCLPGQTAAPFPHPALRQWSLVPLLNVSTHVTTSLSHHKLCVFLSLPPKRLTTSSFPQRIGLFICGTFAPLLCLCFPSSLLSARVLAGYKRHCCRVTTLLYSKHLATFPHLQT